MSRRLPLAAPALALLLAARAEAGRHDASCATIPSGTLTTLDGQILRPGFDAWGYNYQASRFSGPLCSAYRGAGVCTADPTVHLEMNWNDAWLASTDCDGDGLLDRHRGHDGYIGSGAWLIHHYSGSYAGDGGRLCRWQLLDQIVAVPVGAWLDGGVWYDEDGDEIGEEIWGEFAVVQRIVDDPCGGRVGLQDRGETGLGRQAP